MSSSSSDLSFSGSDSCSLSDAESDWSIVSDSDVDSSGADNSCGSTCISEERSGDATDTEEQNSTTDDDLDEQEDECDVDKPLYPGGRLTVLESYMSITKYSLRHSLTKQALSDLLDLLDCHLPTTRMVSLHKFRKYFLELYEDITFSTHYCCTVCQSPLENASSTCRNGCDKIGSIEFLSIHIEPQLRRRFRG